MPSCQRVNYDQIASTYNQRFQDDRRSGTTTALLKLARELGAERILEVGCGTGHWLADLRAVVDQAYGLDLSIRMLGQAQIRDKRLNLSRGRAERLPFPAASFDLVYCVNAIHHFDAQRDFIGEARRLLRPGGALAVLGMNPHRCRESWYVYDYFPGTFETDLARFPSWGTVLDWMLAWDFAEVEWQPVERFQDHKTGRRVLEDPFLQKHATSQLALLSDEAYEQGINQIQTDLETAKTAGKKLVFPSDISIGMLRGRI